MVELHYLCKNQVTDTQGHSSGSPLAKFEFNNGTAFEIDKYGRRTLPYQPAFKCKLNTATGANLMDSLFLLM